MPVSSQQPQVRDSANNPVRYTDKRRPARHGDTPADLTGQRKVAKDNDGDWLTQRQRCENGPSQTTCSRGQAGTRRSAKSHRFAQKGVSSPAGERT